MTIAIVLIAMATLVLHGVIWAHTRINRRYNVQMVRIWRRYKRQIEETQRRYEERRAEIDRRFQEDLERFRVATGARAPKSPPPSN